MKIFLLFAFTVLFLGSCSTQFQITKKQHSAGYYVSITNNNSKVSSKETNNQANFNIIETETKELNNLQISDASMKKVESTNIAITKVYESKANSAKTNSDNQLNKLDAQEIKSNIKSNKKEIKQLLKKAKNSELSDGELMQILLIILCIILPFVAVGIYTDWDLIKVLICLALCILFWLPGIIYAFLTIFDKI